MEFLSMLSLHVFRTVMETGTFAAAAGKLYISQPAVSGHIHRIEKQLGVVLFETPYGRKLKPTVACNLLYEYAIEIAVKNADLADLLKGDTAGERGRLSLAFSSSATALSSLVGKFANEYPDIQIIVRNPSSTSGREALKKGDLDIGFFPYFDEHQLQCYPMFEEPMEIICSPDHPLARYDYITVEDLHRQIFVACIEGSDYNRLLEAFLTASGISYQESTIRVENGSAILKVVEQGYGLGLLAYSTLEQSLKMGSVTCLTPSRRLPYTFIKTYLFFRSNYKLSATHKLFLGFIYDNIRKYYPYFIMHSPDYLQSAKPQV